MNILYSVFTIKFQTHRIFVESRIIKMTLVCRENEINILGK